MPPVCLAEVFIPVNALPGPVRTNWVSGKVSLGALRSRARILEPPCHGPQPGPTTDTACCLGQLAWISLCLGFLISKMGLPIS